MAKPDEDQFRYMYSPFPTRARRKSDSAKRATAEAKKERRRRYYARDAEKIREKNRLHLAHKRAIAKTKHSRAEPSPAETTRRPELTTAELAVSETLAQMQADRAAQGISFRRANPPNSPTSRGEEEMAIDKEIAALWEQGERLCLSNSDDDMGTGDLGERQRRRLLLVQSLGPRYSSRHTPSPEPPSPGPKTRLPSLYDKLFSTRQEETERKDGPVDR
ncbi:hypothetical protein R3P38DRAFT_2799599 [Favolaschia claudopus]|uniref:Uncharacterized protein n=1 Tax=Favolaschia claudopus TaxID=2862362 RepID=A0AAW0A0G7_9AGAR